MRDISNGDVTASEIKAVIDEHIIGKNAERNRRITYRRLIDGITYEKLAEEFDVSVSQVQRVLRQTEPIVFRYLK